jgi:hypothetical protein
MHKAWFLIGCAVMFSVACVGSAIAGVPPDNQLVELTCSAGGSPTKWDFKDALTIVSLIFTAVTAVIAAYATSKFTKIEKLEEREFLIKQHLQTQRASVLMPLFTALLTKEIVEEKFKDSTSWSHEMKTLRGNLSTQYSGGAGLFLGEDARKIYRLVQERLGHLKDWQEVRVHERFAHYEDEAKPWRAVHRCLSTLRTALIVDVGARGSEDENSNRVIQKFSAKKNDKKFSAKAMDDLEDQRLLDYLILVDIEVEPDAPENWPDVPDEWKP